MDFTGLNGLGQKNVVNPPSNSQPQPRYDDERVIQLANTTLSANSNSTSPLFAASTTMNLTPSPIYEPIMRFFPGLGAYKGDPSLNGYGSMHLFAGPKYDGVFRDGIPCGPGKWTCNGGTFSVLPNHTYPTGNTWHILKDYTLYQGPFSRQGLPHGSGLRVDVTGQVSQVTYDSGVLQEDVYILESSNNIHGSLMSGPVHTSPSQVSFAENNNSPTEAQRHQIPSEPSDREGVALPGNRTVNVETSIDTDHANIIRHEFNGSIVAEPNLMLPRVQNIVHTLNDNNILASIQNHNIPMQAPSVKRVRTFECVLERKIYNISGHLIHTIKSIQTTVLSETYMYGRLTFIGTDVKRIIEIKNYDNNPEYQMEQE